MPKPITRLKMQAKAKVDFLNGESFTTGPFEFKERSRNRPNATSDTQATVRMVGSPNQSFLGPSSRMYSMPPRKTAMEIRWA